MIKSISGSSSATEICDDCKTYIRDFNIPAAETIWSDNTTWEVEGLIIYITNNVVKCDNCQ